MNSKEFNRLYLGEYPLPDERQTAILDRILKYYKDTPDSMDNREAMKHWMGFSKWCKERGYTPKEINQAKRDAAPYI